MKIRRVQAREDWLGLFYVGWIGNKVDPTDHYGISISFGRKTLLFFWK